MSDDHGRVGDTTPADGAADTHTGTIRLGRAALVTTADADRRTERPSLSAVDRKAWPHGPASCLLQPETP